MMNIPQNNPLHTTAAKLAASIAARQQAHPASLPELGQLQAAAVRVRLPAAQRQDVGAVAAPHDLGSGARRLWELLHSIATDVATARGYVGGTSQVVMHQAQELLAAALGCNRVTLWRWAGQLQAVGLIERRQHFTTTWAGQGRTVTRADGTLFAVALRAGHRARLRFDDLKAKWRDLDAARTAGNTAFSVLQQSSTLTGDRWLQLLKSWAVNPDSDHISPLNHDRCSGPPDVPNTVPAVVYALGTLRDAHPTKRAALVGMLGSALGHALGDTGSRRYYCAAIWAAWRSECEGRGGLQALAAQLGRLQADMAEWSELRRPGALLAARLR